MQLQFYYAHNSLSCYIKETTDKRASPVKYFASTMCKGSIDG